MTSQNFSRRKIGTTTAATLGAMALVLSMEPTMGLSPFGVADAHVIQGCTPGFWKNHLDAWAVTGYSPDQQYSDVFGFEVPGHEDLTLHEALSISGGGAEYALVRHSVAGLLNAAHPDVNYRYSESTLISKVQDGADPIWTTIFPGNDRDEEKQKEHLEAANELVCPL